MLRSWSLLGEFHLFLALEPRLITPQRKQLLHKIFIAVHIVSTVVKTVVLRLFPLFSQGFPYAFLWS